MAGDVFCIRDTFSSKVNRFTKSIARPSADKVGSSYGNLELHDSRQDPIMLVPIRSFHTFFIFDEILINKLVCAKIRIFYLDYILW